MSTDHPVAHTPFGRLLKRYRLAAGLSQEALADRAGLSWRTISDLERGIKQGPRGSTARLLAEALALVGEARAALLASALPRDPVGAEPTTAASPPVAVPTSLPPDSVSTSPSPAAVPTNLPLALTSFVGRERELAAVRRLLGQTRLLTLTGAGGCGKTRLALQLARTLAREAGEAAGYADGIWLVELAPLAEPTLVPAALATVLGLREEPGRSLSETLVAQLKDQHLLLVLDNCEHLVAACAELASAVLRSCEHVRLLATSRESLRVAGERRYRVPALAVPPLDQLPSPEVLCEYPAVALFMARAQERRADFALSARNARAVAQVCARLDGMPLALELAAARVDSLGVEAIAARLDDRFKLLRGGARDALPRQRTLRATLDWSYDLLSEPEQLLLDRLAVFAGGWTLAAAEAVIGAGEGIADWEVLDLLGSLVHKSLVQAGEVHEDLRYRLLETVRQYGLERLVAAGGLATVRDRHLRWCLALAEEAEPQLRGSEQGAWLAALEAEHDNLRAALAWGLREEGMDPAAGLRLAGALGQFWWVRGHLSEGRQWLGEALAGGQAAAAPSGPRARALAFAGQLAGMQGDLAEARALLEESLALHRELGDRGGSARVLHNLGVVAGRLGDFTWTRALLEEGLALYRQLSDRNGSARVLHDLGILAERMGDLTGGRALLEESLALYRELGDRGGIAIALNNLGCLAESLADYQGARALLEEGLALYREVGHRLGIAYALHDLGVVAGRLGDFTGARALLEESLVLYRELGDKEGVAYVLEGFARLAGAEGRPGRAARLWGAAGALRGALGTPLPPSPLAEQQQALLLLRAALGEEACDAAWAKGRALSLEEAMVLALEGHAEVAQQQ